MEKSIKGRYGEDIVETCFIDTTGQNLSDYPEIQKVVRAGYAFPITAINGQARLAGTVAIDAIVKIINELMKDSNE